MSGDANAAGNQSKKSLILNAFVEMCTSRTYPYTSYSFTHPCIGSGHQSPGLWRHPDDESHRFNDVDHWIELAQLLESAKFHGIFIADVLGQSLRVEDIDIMQHSDRRMRNRWLRCVQGTQEP